MHKRKIFAHFWKLKGNKELIQRFFSQFFFGKKFISISKEYNYSDFKLFSSIKKIKIFHPLLMQNYSHRHHRKNFNSFIFIGYKKWRCTKKNFTKMKSKMKERSYSILLINCMKHSKKFRYRLELRNFPKIFIKNEINNNS